MSTCHDRELELAHRLPPARHAGEVLTERLALTGLNLESIAESAATSAIDLEVTSNRPDCLGHLGVAREISVLFEKPLRSRPAAGDFGAAGRGLHRE